MVNKLNLINEKVLKICQSVAVALTFLIIISTSVQVFTRYVLGASLIGTEEVARYSFIWANMLGASICVSRFSHATISFLPDNLKGKSKTFQECFVQAMIMIMAIILITQGYNMILVTLKQLSPTLNIPMWMIYLSIPVGGATMLLGSLCNMLNIFSKKDDGGEQ
ncbi:MAG: TRAP transporter small permease [Bacteroidales bacterium]|nr:TRAP transporter small permease [Bacteroidales bacterium]